MLNSIDISRTYIFREIKIQFHEGLLRHNIRDATVNT